jgi:hypothetical protein
MTTMAVHVNRRAATVPVVGRLGGPRPKQITGKRSGAFHGGGGTASLQGRISQTRRREFLDRPLRKSTMAAALASLSTLPRPHTRRIRAWPCFSFLAVSRWAGTTRFALSLSWWAATPRLVRSRNRTLSRPKRIDSNPYRRLPIKLRYHLVQMNDTIGGGGVGRRRVVHNRRAVKGGGAHRNAALT